MKIEEREREKREKKRETEREIERERETDRQTERYSERYLTPNIRKRGKNSRKKSVVNERQGAEKYRHFITTSIIFAYS